MRALPRRRRKSYPQQDRTLGAAARGNRTDKRKLSLGDRQRMQTAVLYHDDELVSTRGRAGTAAQGRRHEVDAGTLVDRIDYTAKTRQQAATAANEPCTSRLT